MNEEQRTQAIINEHAEVECQGCKWLGSEDDACRDNTEIAPGRYSVERKCPNCGGTEVWDYESALYRAGYDYAC